MKEETEMVTVKFYAGAAQAAGIDEAQVDYSCGASIVDTVKAASPKDIGTVLSVSSFLVNGELAAGTEPVEKFTSQGSEADRAGIQIDVLPPFAGG